MQANRLKTSPLLSRMFFRAKASIDLIIDIKANLLFLLVKSSFNALVPS
jgi:hypothetical protein